MLLRKALAVSLLSLMTLSNVTLAVERGQALADSCLSCHAGVDQNATIVNLSQYPASAIVSQMKAFRDGSRVSTVMNRHAKGYSDEDIAQLAKYIGIQGQ
jgi:cytochrome subunit of sulfide dehydrogenase